MKKILILFISTLCTGMGLGILIAQQLIIERHKEVVSKNKDQYDRLDLHYITFGEKI